MNEMIINYIKEKRLNSKDRNRDHAYRRFYLYNMLRTQGLSYKDIGDLFNRNHASIMHGIKTHNNLTSVKDWIYFETTEQERLMFDKLSADYDIIEDILNCYSLEKLKKIRFRVRNNLYKNLSLSPV